MKNEKLWQLFSLTKFFLDAKLKFEWAFRDEQFNFLNTFFPLPPLFYADVESNSFRCCVRVQIQMGKRKFGKFSCVTVSNLFFFLPRFFKATYPRNFGKNTPEKDEKWIIKQATRILTFLISEIFVNCLPNSHKSTPNFSAQFRTLWKERKKKWKIET